MTNPQNCTVVAEKLIFHLRTGQDTHLRRELTQRICTLAERYAPSNEWYLDTMNEVFELGGDLLQPEVAHNLMRFIAEGVDDDAHNNKFRTYAVNTYVKLLEKPVLPDILLQVISWVLGEYASLCSPQTGYTTNDITDILCESVNRSLESTTTRSYIVTALAKIVAREESLRGDANIEDLVEKFKDSRVADLQQRCYEFSRMKQQPKVMRVVLPYDGSCEDIEVDRGLAFLNAFVARVGGPKYKTKEERKREKEARGRRW